MRRLFILNFHGIGRAPHELAANEQRVWIDRLFFEAILDSLKGSNDVALTFDDANESDYSIALPTLQARGVPAQFFLVADRIGRAGYLSLRQVQALAAAGMTFGNHGMRHRPWAGLSPADLHEELIVARDRLEQMLGKPVACAACPFGSYNHRVLRELRAAGYTRVYTSDGGRARADSFLQPRKSVYRADGLAPIMLALRSEGNGLRSLWRGAKRLVKRWR